MDYRYNSESKHKTMVHILVISTSLESECFKKIMNTFPLGSFFSLVSKLRRLRMLIKCNNQRQGSWVLLPLMPARLDQLVAEIAMDDDGASDARNWSRNHRISTDWWRLSDWITPHLRQFAGPFCALLLYHSMVHKRSPPLVWQLSADAKTLGAYIGRNSFWADSCSGMHVLRKKSEHWDHIVTDGPKNYYSFPLTYIAICVVGSSCWITEKRVRQLSPNILKWWSRLREYSRINEKEGSALRSRVLINANCRFSCNKISVCHTLAGGKACMHCQPRISQWVWTKREFKLKIIKDSERLTLLVF